MLQTADVAPGVAPIATGAVAIADTLFSFDVQNVVAPPANSQLGVEFAAGYFWVTGRSTADNVRKLYKFDRNGTLVSSSLQGTLSAFGWRDLAFDGTYLYASDEDEFAKIDPATGLKVGTLPKPAGMTVLRGLAFDPVSRHFWTKDFSGPLVEFDSLGTTINSYPNLTPAYGLAWDQWTPGGPSLWMWAQTGPQNGPLCTAVQVNPITGAETGLQFTGVDFRPDSLNDLAGGATISREYDSTRVVFIGLHQSESDRVVVYDLTLLPPGPPNLSLPPNDASDVATTIAFTWNPVIGGTEYQLQVSLDSLFSIVVVDSLVTGTSLQVGPLSDTTRFFWRVRSGNGAGNGPWSAIWTFITGVTLGVSSDSELPAKFSLDQNYPNPFNPSTRIGFALPHTEFVTIEVFSIAAQRVKVLVNEQRSAGYHTVDFDGTSLPSGVYYYTMRAGKFSASRSLLLLK